MAVLARLTIGTTLVALCCGTPAVSSFAQSQTYPPAFPRKNATKLLETDRIVVWDIVWPKGEPSPLHRHVFDQVGTYYQAGGRVITPLDGPPQQSTTTVGRISTTRRGTTHVEEGTTDPPLGAVFIELKSEAPSQDAERSSSPPKIEAKQVHSENRVIVWDFTWEKTATPPTTRYERETVAVWLTPGTLRVVSDRGEAQVVNVRPGTVWHRPRGTIETEELISGSPRAIIFELR